MNIEFDQNAPAAPKKRNIWIWLIPLLLVFFGGPIVCCGGGIFFGMGLMKAPVNAAVEALNADPTVTAKMGTPVEAGSSMSINNYTNNNNNGGASIEFNCSGPSASAQVSGRMKLIAGTWSPDGLTVTFDDGTTTTLQ